MALGCAENIRRLCDSDMETPMLGIHLHCFSCINVNCTVLSQAGVSCEIIPCGLDCGAIFHACKSEEHRLQCLNRKELEAKETGVPLEDIHPHCVSCINIRCTVRPQVGANCKIIPCDLDCGAIFHACKREEHRLLCLNEKVPCNNAAYGCPCLMPRKQIGKHLSVCPASVIHCRMEWNRWHLDVHSEKKLQRYNNAMLQQPQLDVALALRDQRMLRQWCSANKNTQRVLRNKFKNYPFPLLVYKMPTCTNSEETALTAKIDPSAEGSSKWESRAAPPGLQSSVCSELYRDCSHLVETLNVASSLISGCDNPQIGTRDCYQVPKCLDDYYLHNSSEDEKLAMLRCIHPIPKCKCDRGFNYISGGIYSDMNLLANKCDVTKQGHCSEKQSIEKVNMEKVLRIKDDCDVMCFEDTSGTEFQSVAPWLNLETITCLHHSQPKAMYTFLCCQEFRRDEFSWHYKNVHSEIHDGLNGWLQQRCPLAQYGCMFYRQRLNPVPKGSMVVYNEQLESFGFRPPAVPLADGTTFNISNNIHNGTHSFDGKASIEEHYGSNSRNAQITELPFEILQHIARFLDSFSLSNLSLTSSLMRDVCCSLLEDRGIVVLQWERHTSEKTTWRVAHKRWFFSSHFSPITQWNFEDSSNMSNHLKTCLYFNRNLKTEPYYHPMGWSLPSELVRNTVSLN